MAPNPIHDVRRCNTYVTEYRQCPYPPTRHYVRETRFGYLMVCYCYNHDYDQPGLVAPERFEAFVSMHEVMAL